MTDGAPPVRVLCCISSLEGGGAERVMSTLASEFVAQGAAAAVVTFLPPTTRDYALDARVDRYSLDVGVGPATPLAAMRRNLTRIARLRARCAVWRPDVVLGFMESPNVSSIISARMMGCAVVVSERVDPRTYRLAQPWRALRRALYPLADAVVLQTESVAQGWARTFLSPDKISVLPNPLSLPVRTVPLPLSEREPVILAAGRLDEQKGFDVLIDAFSDIATTVPGIRLEIAGEGPARDALEARIAATGLGGRARLLGRVADLPDRAARAQLFVLSSRFEGFPNVLLEALAVGTPVVSTDCRSGPRDILGEHPLFPLVTAGDRVALARGIRDGLAAEKFPARAAAAGQIATRYSGPTVAARWLDLLTRVSGRAR